MGRIVAEDISQTAAEDVSQTVTALINAAISGEAFTVFSYVFAIKKLITYLVILA